MVDAFIDIARRSGMRMSTSDIDDYLSQMVLFAQLVGINRESVPDSLDRLESYMQEMQPKLMASEEAKRTAVFLTFPPMPTVVRIATPATALWASVATLAAASLPRWARDMYGWPSLPGQERFTDRSLIAFRKSALRLPEIARMSPYARAARKEEHEQLAGER